MSFFLYYYYYYYYYYYLLSYITAFFIHFSMPVFIKLPVL
jgi:hypothetical protein